MVDVKIYSLMKVVETGSFTKAAELLSMTQPAISRHIRLLEEELNTRIFERSHTELHLTKEGEIVVKYAKRMLAMDANLRKALTDKKEKITSLTIGITHTVESSTIVETLAGYVTGRGGMNLKILTDTADNLYAMLKSYELDFAIVEGRVKLPSLRYLMLDTDCLVLAVSPGHPLARQGTVSIEQLKQEKMILRLPSSNTRNLFASSLERLNMGIEEFDVILEIDNIATIKDLIRRDFGVSVLAKSACADELGKGKIVALSIENLSMIREINLVCREDFDHQEVLTDIVRRYNEIAPTVH